MRWFWIDQFTEFVSGEFAKARKKVTLSEPHVHDYVPGWPVLPSSFLIEGLAQCGGLLVSETHRFQKKVVLAKLTRATFDGVCIAGEMIEYETRIERMTEEGGIVRGICTSGDRTVVDADIVFAYLVGEDFKNVTLFTDRELMKMIRALRLFDVAVNPDGSKVEIPQHLAVAERETASQEVQDAVHNLTAVKQT